jgi:hypothetical protein
MAARGGNRLIELTDLKPLGLSWAAGGAANLPRAADFAGAFTQH